MTTKARAPSPSAQLSAFLSRFPADTVALAKRCMPKLRRTFPGCYQIVYDYPNSVVVAFSMSERGYEAIVAMTVVLSGVKLYFDKSIPDPKGLLEGSGGKVRSVNVESAADIDRGDINALIKAAIKHAGVKFVRTRTARMIIQTKKRAKA